VKKSGQEFLDRLHQEILVGDGAFGTRLYEMGIGFDLSCEEFNLTRPELVEQILREYADAGATVIETNTFCLNHHKQRNYGLDKKIREMGIAAAKIARKVAGTNKFVAGSIGPLVRRKRDLDEYSESEIQKMFREPMEALVEGGADLLILETFTSLNELEQALKVAKGLDVPIVCQMAFGEEGTTAVGVTVERALKKLTDWGADVVGANCRSGPLVLKDVLDRGSKVTHLPISVFPNAGYAQQIDGRYVYQASPDYFGEQAKALSGVGASLIGGCCGTTSAHIRAIAQAAKKLKPMARKKPVTKLAEVEEVLPKRGAGGSKFRNLVSNSNVFITVEIEPPRDLNLKKSIDGAREVAKAGCDALNVPDNALAVAKMDNVIFADLLKQHVELPLILHLTCRDKNTIALQADLLGSQAVGIDAILAVTGDPASIGDQPGASSVYDINSIGLVDMISTLNQGITPSGKKLAQPTDFAVGVALNPNVYGELGLVGALKKLQKKIDAGAHFIETQPMYDPKLLHALVKVLPQVSVPLFLGLMPIMNKKNAEFFHHEVPGVKIPQEIRDRFEGLGKEEAEQEGIRQAKELIDIAVSGGIRHFYIVPPLGRFSVAATLTSYIRSKF